MSVSRDVLAYEPEPSNILEATWLNGSTIFGFNALGAAGAGDEGAFAVGGADAESRLQLAATMFANTRDGMLVTDADGRIVDVNPAFMRVTGYRRDEVIGRHPDLLKSDRHPPEFYQAMWSELQAAGFWRGEIWNRGKSGESYLELLSIGAIRDRHGALTHYLAIYTEIMALKESQQRLEYLAYHDALTQLPNRVLLADRIDQAISRARRRNTMIAVCFADLDHFKPINDTYGHEVGDQLLVEVAGRFRGAMREGDTVARLGGDEFALLLGDLETAHAAAEILQRLLAVVAKPYQLAGEVSATISVSIGYTVVSAEEGDADSLIRRADQAMYQAKLEGRNKLHCFDVANDRAVRHRQENVDRLREALAGGELCLYYQPKVDLRRGAVVGVEALIRWRHPERGLLLPGEFLGPLGNHVLLADIGDWVIGEALRQMRAWKQCGLKVAVGVNLSPLHLLRQGFVPRLKHWLAEFPDVDPHYLEFEILESAALDDVMHVSRLIGQCRELGVEFALDDFGTGYSSLLYLKRLPAKTLKVDQSFVRDILDTAEGAETMAGIVTLAGAFRRRLVAEGMETVEQGIALLRMQCDIAQGFGIARPMAAAALPNWLAAFSPDPSWRESVEIPWRRSDFPLLAAEVEQRRLLQQLRDAVESGREPPSSALATTDRESHFGRWLHGLGRNRYGDLPEFKALPGIYSGVARSGGEIVAALVRGEAERARSLLPAFIGDSESLVACLRALRLVVSKFTEACRRGSGAQPLAAST